MNKCQDVDKKDIDKARKQICVGGDDKRASLVNSVENI